MKLNLPLNGSCRCGRVHLHATAPPLITSACHCQGCQKMSASAFSLSALFSADALNVEGEVVIGGLHGPEQRHHHCTHCLAWLFTRIEGLEDKVNVRAPVFDELGWFTPNIETATDEKLAWASVPASRSYPSLPFAADFPKLMQDYAATLASPSKEPIHG